MDPTASVPPSPAGNEERELLARAVASYSTYLMFVAARLKGQNSLTDEAVSDLAQKATLAALTKIRAGTGRLPNQEPAEMRAWLRKILLNTYRDARRQHGTRARFVNAIPPAAAGLSPSGEAALNETAQRLADARAKLEPDDRQILEWREDERLTFEEIGKRRGYSTSYASRAYQKAREKFETLYPGDACPRPA